MYIYEVQNSLPTHIDRGGCIFLGNNLVWPISKYKPYTPTEHTMLYIDWCGNCTWCYVNTNHTVFCKKETATSLVCDGSYLSCLCMRYATFSGWQPICWHYQNFVWMWIYVPSRTDWTSDWPFYMVRWNNRSTNCYSDIAWLFRPTSHCIESWSWGSCRTYRNICWWAFITKYQICNYTSWPWGSSVHSATSSFFWSECRIYSCDPSYCYNFVINYCNIWEVIVEDRPRSGDEIIEYVNNTKSKYRW